MDNTNTPTPQPVAPPEPVEQNHTAAPVTPQSAPQTEPVVSPPTVVSAAQPPKKSILKNTLIIVASTVAFAVLIVGIGFYVLIALFFNATGGQCGVHSETHKQEVPKVAVLNSITVVPGQPNEPASIYDSSDGECNLDVAQSYSATKSFTVTMDGATALSTVTDSLEQQGFTLSKQVFRHGDTGCSKTIWGWANYTGRSTTITVAFGNPTQQCSDPPHTYLISTLPSVSDVDFSNASVTSIKATVSTPDETLQ